MATFLRRLCLFGVLATTGLVLANCQRQAEERDVPAPTERTEPTMRADDGMGAGRYDAGVAPRPDAGMGEEPIDAGTMDAGMR